MIFDADHDRASMCRCSRSVARRPCVLAWPFPPRGSGRRHRRLVSFVFRPCCGDIYDLWPCRWSSNRGWFFFDRRANPLSFHKGAQVIDAISNRATDLDILYFAGRPQFAQKPGRNVEFGCRLWFIKQDGHRSIFPRLTLNVSATILGLSAMVSPGLS